MASPLLRAAMTTVLSKNSKICNNKNSYDKCSKTTDWNANTTIYRTANSVVIKWTIIMLIIQTIAQYLQNFVPLGTRWESQQI